MKNFIETHIDQDALKNVLKEIQQQLTFVMVVAFDKDERWCPGFFNAICGFADDKDPLVGLAAFDFIEEMANVDTLYAKGLKKHIEHTKAPREEIFSKFKNPDHLFVYKDCLLEMVSDLFDQLKTKMENDPLAFGKEPAKLIETYIKKFELILKVEKEASAFSDIDEGIEFIRDSYNGRGFGDRLIHHLGALIGLYYIFTVYEPDTLLVVKSFRSKTLEVITDFSSGIRVSISSRKEVK